GAQVNGLRSLAVQLEGHLLKVEDDVSGIFHHAGNGLELVQHTFDFDRRNRRALDGRQQHAPQGVADGGAEAPLKRLRPEHSVFVGEAFGVNRQPFWFLKTFPKHLRFSPLRLAGWPAAGSSAEKGRSGTKCVGREPAVSTRLTAFSPCDCITNRWLSLPRLLLRIEFDNQLLIDRQVDVVPLGQVYHPALERLAI